MCTAELLGCAYGLLLNELYRSPKLLLESVLSLMDSALALDTGSVCDKGSNEFNISVGIILYVCRMAARVLNYVHYVVRRTDHPDDGVDVPVRDPAPDKESIGILRKAQDEITERLQTSYAEILDDYLARLRKQMEDAPDNSELIQANAKLACNLHAHKLLALRTLGVRGQKRPLDLKAATTLLSSFVFLTTRHIW